MTQSKWNSPKGPRWRATKAGKKLSLNVDILPPNLNPELSVVIPCHNEFAYVEKILCEWAGCLRTEAINFEIIVVNDGSTDGTGRVLDTLRREFCELRVIHQLNVGHGRAVRRGYEAARGRFVLQVDSSARYDTTDFLRMWKQRHRHHLILGTRTHRLDSWTRRAASRLLKQCIRLLFRVSLQDPNIPFRLFRNIALSSCLTRIPRHFESVNLSLSILIKGNYPAHVLEMPVPFRFRPGGRSHRGLAMLLGLSFQYLLELIRLRLFRPRHPFPLGSEAAVTP